MSQQEYILTHNEANVLASFRDATAGLSQLAVATQLTPSEVREVMTHLAAKHLATLQEGWGQLTDEGRYVRDLLQQRARKQSQLPTYPRVIIVPDQDKGKTPPVCLVVGIHSGEWPACCRSL